MACDDKKNDLIEMHWVGRTEEAMVAGLRIAACETPGCKAEDYWLDGDRRDEKRARRWAAKHRRH